MGMRHAPAATPPMDQRGFLNDKEGGLPAPKGTCLSPTRRCARPCRSTQSPLQEAFSTPWCHSPRPHADGHAPEKPSTSTTASTSHGSQWCTRRSPPAAPGETLRPTMARSGWRVGLRATGWAMHHGTRGAWIFTALPTNALSASIVCRATPRRPIADVENSRLTTPLARL